MFIEQVSFRCIRKIPWKDQRVDIGNKYLDSLWGAQADTQSSQSAPLVPQAP